MNNVNPIFKGILDNIWMQPVTLANIRGEGIKNDTRDSSKDTERVKSPKRSV
jgi:hypothetical protein